MQAVAVLQAQKEEAARSLKELQTALAKSVTLKYTPHLVFHQDNSIERGVRVIDILQKIEIPANDPE